MDVSLTWMFVLLVICLLADGFWRPVGMYHFPFLAAVMAFGFLLPQLPAVATDRFLPQGALAATMFMGCLCLLMLRLGWMFGKPIQSLKCAFSERKLLYLALGLSAIGSYFYFLLSRVPGDQLIGVQVTGMPVVYLFFARFISYGLCIAVLCFVNRPSYFGAGVLLYDLLFLLDRLIVSGSRAASVELILMVLLALWFRYRFIIPRIVMIGTIAIGTFLMTSMGDYRKVTRENSSVVMGEILEINFKQNFETAVEKGGDEIRNAIYRIDNINRRLELDYGKFHWNRIVFNFVPAQIFGASFKRSLELDVPALDRNYSPSTGTTETGFVDAFASFWYFGAIKFFLLAWMMRAIWETADRGAFLGQLLYILSIVPAMHAVSHQTDWVVPVWIHMLIFLAPLLYLCRTDIRPAGLISPLRGPAV